MTTRILQRIVASGIRTLRSPNLAKVVVTHLSTHSTHAFSATTEQEIKALIKDVNPASSAISVDAKNEIKVRSESPFFYRCCRKRCETDSGTCHMPFLFLQDPVLICNTAWRRVVDKMGGL
jgi:hypothetical protein